MQFHPLPDLHRPLLDKFYRAHRSGMRVRGQAWVAKEGEIVGALSLTPLAGGHWLTGLFVAPRWRGRGVAAGLLETAIAATSCDIWLFCEPGLIGFYRQTGFVETADLPPELSSRLSRYRQTKPLVALCYAS